MVKEPAEDDGSAGEDAHVAADTNSVALAVATIQGSESSQEAPARTPIIIPTGSLSPAEKKDLAKQSHLITNGFKSIESKGVEVSEALLRIKEGWLFRGPEHKSFVAFCEKMFGIGKSRAYELVGAAEVRRQFSAMAEKSVRPVNERQIRPLTRLKTAEEREAAWDRAVVIAAGATVTERHVRKAISDLRKKPKVEDPAPELPTWRKFCTNLFRENGYGAVFEQPIKWPTEAVDLYSEAVGRHVKFIEKLGLPEAACVKALTKAGIDCTVIVSADANSPGLLFSLEDEIIESFTPEFDFTANDLGIFIGDEDKFYAQGELDQKFHAVWTPITPEEILAIGVNNGQVTVDSSDPQNTTAFVEAAGDETAEPTSRETKSSPPKPPKGAAKK